MTRYNPAAPRNELSLDHMQIGAADAAGVDFDQYLVLPHMGHANIYQMQWIVFDRLRTLEDARLHGAFQFIESPLPRMLHEVTACSFEQNCSSCLEQSWLPSFRECHTAAAPAKVVYSHSLQ